MTNNPLMFIVYVIISLYVFGYIVDRLSSHDNGPDHSGF